MSSHLIAPDRVLPTLNADGTRRKIHPQLHRGRLWWARLVVAWTLIALFVATPFIYINGKPAILLNIPEREFVLFGRTFLPTDGVLLMLMLLAIFIGIFWITALLGRVWCGWGCPQTVYMEFVYRPIERLFEGNRGAQIRLDRKGLSLRRILKNLTFVVLSVLVANVFLAYFVGVEALSRWVQQSPIEHPTPFLVMAVTAGLVFFDFAYFREQMCTVICPYARLQSVLLDKKSLIVGYDLKRGEPRTKGKPKPGAGDCIDCKACVTTCPTGIDIREGLQLECVACTQCIDACNSIMKRVGKPPGLIRFGTQSALEHGQRPKTLLRARVLIYPVLLAFLIAALWLFGGNPQTADVTVLRGIAAPYSLQGNEVTNQIRIKIQNRGNSDTNYKVELLNPGPMQMVAPENPLPVEAGEQNSTSVFVTAPKDAFEAGTRPIQFKISGPEGFEALVNYKLLGPKGTGN